MVRGVGAACLTDGLNGAVLPRSLVRAHPLPPVPMPSLTRLRAAAAILALAVVPAVATAQVTAITLPAGTIGNQAWPGALGIDFDVNQAITITSLGAFDSGADGFATAKTVRIYDRTTQTVVGPSLTFLAGTGTLIGSYRFAPSGLISFVLAAGFQGSIVADGFGQADPNYNTSGSPFPGTVNTGGGAITFVGGARYANTAGVYPTILDGGPAVRYGAGSFQFNVVSTVPEPGTWALMGTGLIGLAGIARRKRTSTV